MACKLQLWEVVVNLLGCFLPHVFFLSRGVASNLLGWLGGDRKDDYERQIAREVGASIKARRVELGLSQDALAELLEVGPEAVSRMERGAVSLTIPKLVELANALKSPVEAFLPGASRSVQSGAQQVGLMLQNLDKRDAKFVVEMVERMTQHLKV